MSKISTKDVGVLGVTSVDDELFVLLYQDDNQVAVYSVNDYRRLRRLNLPELKKHYINGLTSCVRHKRLYMSDYESRCIHRYDLAGRAKGVLKKLSNITTKWAVPGNLYGLSITPSCNLLVTCQQPNKLVELNADSGQCVREIALQSDIEYPCHGVQLTTGQYIVCHSGSLKLCAVDGDGGVISSDSGQCGRVADQLNCPIHITVDEHSQFVFVADCGTENRVVMLRPTLQSVRYISHGLSRPRRLYLHDATRRLYVGQLGGDVVVIQL